MSTRSDEGEVFEEKPDDLLHVVNVAEDKTSSNQSHEEKKGRWGTVLKNVWKGPDKSAAAVSQKESKRAGLRSMLRTIIFNNENEDTAAELPFNEELALHCLTPEELQTVAKEAFQHHYPEYSPPTTMQARKEHPLGFHIVDYKKSGRFPEAPTRKQWESARSHNGIRSAFRVSSVDEDRRVEFICKQLAHNNLKGVVSVGNPSAEKVYVASFQGMSLKESGRGVRLGGSLAFCDTLVFLSLSGTGIGPSFSDVGTSLSNHPSLTRLNVSGARLGIDGSKILGQILQKNGKLRHVDASLNNMQDEGCEAVCKGILSNRMSKLGSLNLSTNKIGAKAGMHLSMLIRDHAKLRELMLWRNNLGTRPLILDKSGFDYIVEVLPSASELFHLDVAHNNIHSEAVEQLISACEVTFIPSGGRAKNRFSFDEGSDDVASLKMFESEESTEVGAAGAGAGSSANWISLNTAVKKDIQTPSKNLPLRHITIVAGNEVFPDHLRQLSNYFEITPYTTASRGGTAAIKF
eukprot:TRINITY_DN16474_c0_g1_i1.p1 TRINITY_DN16474_c0_g1~~TRINITY_DN16474_c0_g1_i1.p1  ORF type:complete len:532 (+),score=93.06 TRINITY_DN16474_c0_g1_i1:41-1597(+)